MATETFYKRIVLSDEAAERLAIGLEKPRTPFVPHFDMDEELRRSEKWLDRYISSRVVPCSYITPYLVPQAAKAHTL
ncbi:MAG: hypothetical protein FWH07_01150 [Oscillospiraceae bacterium]|nr:hypothetical protein [Oscillospiraceae bacterium]